MMAMVFEGARQIQDEDHRVEGYEISNMSIDKAMIIPTSDHGLETSLNMKRHEPEGSPSHRKVETFDFTIYSKLLDAAWQKNCSGSLNIQYKPVTEYLGADGVSSDINEYRENYLSHQETCTETVSARQLYEALETIGMKYGPTFQNITSVSKKDNISCTTVRIPDTKSQMPGKYEYPHLIHPATLDAMFQTVFVAGNEPMVPSHVQSLFISADFPEGAGADLRGYSIASREGLRDAIGNIVMSDGAWDKPKLIVKNLHFTALLTASDDTTERGFLPNHHNLCAELVWKEDVTTANPASFSEWLELASFKNPAMNVLDTCCENTDSMFSRLKVLGGQNDANPQFSKYIFSNISDENLGRDRNLLENWPDYVDFKLLDPATDVSKQGFKPRSFDLVFANTTDATFLNTLRGLLRVGGKLVFMSPIPALESDSDRREEDLTDLRGENATLVAAEIRQDPLLLDAADSLPDLILKDDIGRENLAAKVFLPNSKATPVVPLSSREVLILLPVDPSPKLQELSISLADALLLAGLKVASSTLTNSNVSFSAKLCLALVEVESSLVSNWTDEEFHAFRSLILEAKGCMWVAKGGQMNSKSPFTAPITALFRTIRSEDPQKAIVTLDLDAETDLASDSTGRAVLSTFLKSFDSQERLEEMEYAEYGGKIFIPRAVLEGHLSSRIEHDGKPRAPKLQHLFQAERPLQLEVGTLGKLSSIHFNDDTRALIQLNPRDVEIWVQAVGVNQLDVRTALGQTTRDTIGSDVAGIVTRIGSDVSKFKAGDRVTTIVPGAFKTFVRSCDSTVQRIADDMSFESAASLPTDLITAYYAIITIGRLQVGESIFINGGAGSFVNVAVQVAKNIGAEIFVTATSSEDRTVVLETYGIQDDHVFDNSTSLSHIIPQGMRFDLVLNSLKGNLRSQAWDYVRECKSTGT